MPNDSKVIRRVSKAPLSPPKALLPLLSVFFLWLNQLSFTSPPPTTKMDAGFLLSEDVRFFLSGLPREERPVLAFHGHSPPPFLCVIGVLSILFRPPPFSGAPLHAAPCPRSGSDDLLLVFGSVLTLNLLFSPLKFLRSFSFNDLPFFLGEGMIYVSARLGAAALCSSPRFNGLPL